MDVFLSRLDDEVGAGVEPPRRIRLQAHDRRGEELVDALDAALAARR